MSERGLAELKDAFFEDGLDCSAIEHLGLIDLTKKDFFLSVFSIEVAGGVVSRQVQFFSYHGHDSWQARRNNSRLHGTSLKY